MSKSKGADVHVLPQCSILIPHLSLSVHWKRRAQRFRRRRNPLDHPVVARRFEHVGDQVRELFGFRGAEAARGDRGRTEPDAARDRRFLHIVRDGVLVDGDLGAAERVLGILAGNALAGEIDQEQMAIGASAT